MPDRGRLVVLSGPSGAGKTTICERLIERPEFARVVTCTTRAPRPGEVDGQDYHFLEREEFERRRAGGEFLESAAVHGHLYGTLVDEVSRATAGGRTALLAIDVQGAEQVRRKAEENGAAVDWELKTIFLEAPSPEETRRRILARGAETPQQVTTRLETADREMARRDEFDTIIVNDDLERTVEEVLAYLATPPGSRQEP